jgi:hypothetical protein
MRRTERTFDVYEFEKWACSDPFLAGSWEIRALLSVSTWPGWKRICQIVSLLQLAPDIQEEILFLGCSEPDRGALHLRQVQPIAAVLDWSQQRRLWRKLRPGVSRPKRPPCC